MVLLPRRMEHNLHRQQHLGHQLNWCQTTILSRALFHVIKIDIRLFDVLQINFLFRKEILNEATTIDEGIGMPNWKLCICLVMAWACISGILIKGVKSSGKASYFLAVFPYFVMIILLIRSATLPGSVEGMMFFITPKWEKLWTAQVW